MLFFYANIHPAHISVFTHSDL